jgi:tetratricopeptide (TPR) repeat protein
VAYNSLLLARRKEIHERIGHAIEEIYPDRLEEFYEMLAYHYSRSDNRESAYHYLKLSGNKAVKSCSNREAFQYYKDALALLKEEPETAENRRELLDVILLMAIPMEYLTFPEDSLAILREGERLCDELADRRALATLYSFLSIFHLFKGDPALARGYQEDAFREAEKTEDIEIMARVAPSLCTSNQGAGKFEETVRIAASVIALLEKTHRESELFGLPLNAYATLIGHHGVSMGELGEFEKGAESCEKGVAFAHATVHSFSIGIAEFECGLLCVRRGNGRNAVGHLQTAIEYLERSQTKNFLPLAWDLLGAGYYLLGEFDAALESAEKGLQMQRDTGLSYSLSLHHLTLGRIHTDLGNWREARRYAEEALALARANHERWVEGDALILLGRVMGKTEPSQTDTAEEHILQGMKVFDELKTKPAFATGCLALGELYAGAGEREKARENLAKAQAMFQEMGMDHYFIRTEKLLESL